MPPVFQGDTTSTAGNGNKYSYDEHGYDHNGCNSNGFNIYGYHVEDEYSEEYDLVN